LGSTVGQAFVREFLDSSFWSTSRGRSTLLRRGLIPPEDRESLLTTDLFELYLSSCQNLEDGWVRVISGGVGRSPGSRTKDHHLDLKAVRGAHRNGASLLLTRLQKRRKEIALCCRAVEEAFVRHGVVLVARVGANAYLTPPNASGFKVHNDGHDVIVLQLEGEKRWRLYDFSQTLPLESDPAVLEEPPEPSEELVLSPGDALYVPRGLFHAAETRGSHSLHITLSIHVLTQRDLVQRALDGVPALRRDAPAVGRGGETASVASAELLREVTEALSPERLARVAVATGNEAIVDWEIVPDAHLRSAWRAVESGAAPRFRKAAGVFGVFSGARDGLIELVCPGERIRGASALREPLEFILGSDEAFGVGDVPGPLTWEAKSALLQKLMDGGLVTLADEPDSG